MTRTLILLSNLLISIVSYGQTNNHEFNFGFEKINSQGQLPDKWFQWGSGYKLKVDTITKHGGRNSILIEPIGQKSSNSFGCVAYSIPSKFEGNEIELRAYMKLDIYPGAIKNEHIPKIMDEVF
jgi:hypothetical protein